MSLVHSDSAADHEVIPFLSQVFQISLPRQNACIRLWYPQTYWILYVS